MPAIHSWQPTASVNLVTPHLAAGRCVALPTESTYEIVGSALHPEAIEAMRGFASFDQTPAVVMGDYANLFDWLPLLEGAGVRLYRKMGAGPISLTADAGFRSGLWRLLPEAARRLTVREGQLAVRWPAHPIWDELRLANIPLVSIPLAGAVNADEAARILGDTVACVIDAGPTQFGGLPVAVESAGRRCRSVRIGVITGEQIDELALCRILFVCTGNTCRSPMAEVLCAKLLADGLGCLPHELTQHGFCVQSAGLAAMMGGEASPDAVRVVGERGADLSRHRSRMATMEMLGWADHIFVMTASHGQALVGVPGVPMPRLLSPEGDDVADPIGAELTDYRTCANQIVQYLRQRLPELLES